MSVTFKINRREFGVFVKICGQNFRNTAGYNQDCSLGTWENTNNLELSLAVIELISVKGYSLKFDLLNRLSPTLVCLEAPSLRNSKSLVIQVVVMLKMRRLKKGMKVVAKGSYLELDFNHIIRTTLPLNLQWFEQHGGFGSKLFDQIKARRSAQIGRAHV